MSLELPPNQLGSAGLTTNPATATQDMAGYKIVNLGTPTAATDAATKQYVDSAGGGGASGWSSFPATQTVNMANNALNNASVVNANTDVTAAGGTISLVTTAGSIANKANLSGATNTFTNQQQFNGDNFLVGSSATPIADTFEIHASDVNLRAHGATNALNITSLAATVIAAGGAVNITGGLSSSMYAAAGTVGIGGPINHILVDGNNITNVGDIDSTGNINTTGTVDCDTLAANSIISTGNVNLSGASSVTVPLVPGLANSAASKQYVDNAVGSGGAGLATVNTFTATNNFTGATSQFNVGTSTIPNNSTTVYSDQVSVTSSGPIQILGVGPFPNNPSTVSIGGALDTVDITGNAIECGPITSGEINCSNLTATGVVSGATVLGTIVGAGTLNCTGNATFSGSSVNVPIVPVNIGSAASKQYVDQKTGQPLITTYAPVVNINTPQIININALSITGSTLLLYKITGLYSKNGYVVSLPSLATNIPVGTTVIIQNDYSSTSPLIVNQQPSQLNTFSPISVAYGASLMLVMKSISTEPATQNSLLWVPVTPANYVPLTGTEDGQPITGTVVFQNGAGNIQCDDIQTSIISANAPFNFISIEDPVQTRLLGVRSEDGTAPATIEMALSESATDPDILRVTYDPAGLNAMEVNKDIISNGVNLNAAIAFKDANEFFVSANGSDITGNGSANAPFATIQKAITTAEAALSSNMVINVMAGVYSENLTISKGHILITGNVASDRAIEGVILNGKITINVTDVDNLFNNQVVLSGFHLSGQIEDVSTKQHTVIVNGMRIEADSAISGSAINIIPTSTTQRTFVQQCVITQEADMTATDALINVSVGWLDMTTCGLTVRTLSPCVNIAGSALISRLYESTLESSSTSGSATALLTISSSTTTAHNIAQNTFAIGSTTAKADTPAIRVTSAVPQTLVMAQNFFSIAGTNAATNVIKFTTAPTVILAVANNRAVVNTASAIQTGATVVPLTTVGETFVNSVVAGSGITASTTNGVATIGNSGVLELTAGTNVTITGTKNNYTISATGGSSGVSSVNSATGAITVAAGSGIGVATVDGTITISNTAPVDGVQSVTASTGIVVGGTAADPTIANDGVLTVNSAKGAVTVAAGSGIGVSTVGGTITISNTAPVDGVQSVTAGTGIGIGGTATDPIINNTGVVSATAGTGISLSGTASDITINATGIQAITTGAGLASTGGTSPTLSIANTGVTAGSYTHSSITINEQGQITAASNGTAVSSVIAGDGIEVTSGTQPNSVIVTNNGVRSLTASTGIVVGGTANAPTVANDGVLTVNSAKGAISVVAGTGINVETTSGTLTITNSSPNAGVQSITAGTNISITGTASDPIISTSAIVLNDAVNSSPCTLTGFTSNVSVGSTISSVTPTLIFTYNEVLALPFWRWADKVIGFLGFLTMALNNSHALRWTATISKNGGSHSPVIGTLYFTDSQYFTVPVNMISQLTVNPNSYLSYSTGDTVEIKFYAQNLSGGSDPTVSIPPQALQAIYAPLNTASTPLPPSGTIQVSAPVSTVSPLDPANNYRFENLLGATAELTTYLSGTPETAVTVTAGATYPALVDPAITGRNGYTMTLAGPQAVPFIGGQLPYSQIVNPTTLAWYNGVNVAVHPESAMVSSTTINNSDWTLQWDNPYYGTMQQNDITYPPTVDGMYISVNDGLNLGSYIGLRFYDSAFEITAAPAVGSPVTQFFPWNIGETAKVTFNDTTKEAKLYLSGSLLSTYTLQSGNWEAQIKGQALSAPAGFEPATITNIQFINTIL